MNNVTFDNPYYLLILIPLVLIIIVPFIIVVKKRKLTFQNIASLFLHIIICALVSLSIANIKTENIRQETTIYIVADVSNSTSNVLDVMDDYIDTFAKQKSKSSKLGIVAFASECVELVKPGQELKSLKEATLDSGSTNLENALNYTKNLFDEKYKKRIVILSDGKQIDGNALNVTKALKDNDIRVDAIYINSDYEDDIKELMISDVIGNESTFKDASETLTIQLKSTYDCKAKMTIKDNGKLFKEEIISINIGNQEINYLLTTSEVGLHNYLIEITHEDDVNKENNIYYFSQNIHEKCEVLVIADYADVNIKNTINNYISSFANVTYMFSNQKISSSLENYVKYDEIILSNVDLSEIDDKDEFSSMLETLVSNYGKSLITLGGEKTYYSGDFMTTKLKDLLPVDTNPSDTKEKTALVLVIDNSGSMDGSRLENAKLGAIQCLDVLTPEDYVGIITFADNTEVVSPITKIGNDNNKQSIINSIKRIKSEGGTMMTPGIEEAFKQIKGVEMENKQVILISDGVPGDSGQQAIVQEMANNDIVLSTINLSVYSETFLKNLAEVGNGRYYAISSPSSLPDIILDEVSQVVMDSVITKDTSVNIALKNDPILSGIGSLTNISGYNFTKSKYNATTVLDTTYTTNEGKVIENVPIYSYWSYGSGKVSSFMSSINSYWSTDFFNSTNGQQFFISMIKTNYPNKKNDSHLVVNVNNKGYTSEIIVQTPSYNSNMEMRATVTSPSGKKEKMTLNVSNGKYKNDFNTSEFGRYDLKLEYINYNNSNVYTYETNFNYSYSKEYDIFTKSDNIVLWQIVQDSGIVSDDIVSIAAIEQEDSTYSKYFSKPLLIASLILFIIDVIVRKFNLKDIKKLFQKVKNKFSRTI